MKKKFIIPVAIVAGAVAARVIAKRRGKKSSAGLKNTGSSMRSSSGTPRHSRRSARRSRAGG